jgi:hypothetical protein
MFLILDMPCADFPSQGGPMGIASRIIPKRARRPIASLCIALLALNAVECTYVKPQEAQTIVQPGAQDATMKKIVGVTLKDGRDVRFDVGTHASLRSDTLQAQVEQQPVKFPVSDLQQVWIKSVDGDRTTLLVIGLVVVALVALAGIAGASMSYPIP